MLRSGFEPILKPFDALNINSIVPLGHHQFKNLYQQGSEFENATFRQKQFENS